MGVKYGNGVSFETRNLKFLLDPMNPRANASSTQITDLINGNTLSVYDITLDTEANGLKYYNFPSVVDTQRIDITNTGNLAEFTLNAWIYNKPGGQTRHSILYIYWEIDGDHLDFYSYDFADDYWRGTTSGAVPYNQWINVCTTWDGSVIRHYINGELNWTDSQTSSGTSQSFTQIGGYVNRRMFGYIGFFNVHDACLNSIEIKNNFEVLRGRFGI